jgi:light-regulated signal transduction histidine kinase (bacteriophytochrome)
LAKRLEKSNHELHVVNEEIKSFAYITSHDLRAALLERQLTRRFVLLPAEAVERLSAATIDELDAIGERLLSAATLEEALGSR